MFPIRDEYPATRLPLVTAVLVVACALVFLWEVTVDAAVAARAAFALGMIPAVLLGHAVLAPELVLVPPWMTLVTSMFLHGGVLHLLGNLLFLWVFGNNVEAAMGRGRFLVFYVACGVIAALAHAGSDPLSEVPMVGASGAVSGVLGAYLLLFPRSRVLVVVPLVFLPWTLYLPAAAVLGFWFLVQLIAGILANEDVGGIAWVAHAGGFVAGLLLVAFFRRRGVPLWSRPDHPPPDD
jgi:membrane associated rhomboid family serine protease